MQFADLMRLFREGQNEGRKRGYVSQGACDAEGIAAVVRALRDETAINSCACRFWLDDILGAAGDEVAEPTVGQRLIKAAHEAAAIARGEATDPAPAVCVWTRISEFDMVIHYSTPHGVMNDLHLWRGLQCSACHAPIKFTEAKP